MPVSRLFKFFVVFALVVSSVLLIFYLVEGFYFEPKRDKIRINDLNRIKTAVESYLTYNRSFPRSGEIPFGGVWASLDVTYLKKVPKDPGSSNHLSYCYNNFDNFYLLCASMEGKDYTCPAQSESNRVCNTCQLPEGRVTEYNYCLYGSY